MVNPRIRILRSPVPGKRPSNSQIELGELAINTNDGRLFTKKENVGIGTTVTLLNVWTENVGGGAYGYEGLYITNNNGWVRAKTSFYPTPNTWGLLTLTYNGSGSTNISNFTMYWNTSQLTFNTDGLSTPAVTTDNNYLGVRQPADIQIYRGNMSLFQIYNRVLSLSEIQQNFNATKGRYGL